MYCDSNVYVVGAVDNPSSRIIRIVHISDTMGCEEHLLSSSRIPFGHILIHSGDFGKKSHFLYNFLWRSRSLLGQIDSMNRFFSSLPHPHKIYIPGGNTDSILTSLSSDYVQSLLPEVTYLHNDTLELYSIKIHAATGSLCSKYSSSNKSNKTEMVSVNSNKTNQKSKSIKSRNDSSTINISDAFSKTERDSTDYCHNTSNNNWLNIPEDVDVIVSKDAPWNPLIYHNITERIKPTLLLYGKNDGNYGVLFKDNIVFSNSSFRSYYNLQKKQNNQFNVITATGDPPIASGLRSSSATNHKYNSYCNYNTLDNQGYSGQHNSFTRQYNSDVVSYWGSSHNKSSSSSINCFQMSSRRSNSENSSYLRPESFVRYSNHYEPMVFDVYVPTHPTDDGNDNDEEEEEEDGHNSVYNDNEDSDSDLLTSNDEDECLS